MRTAESKINSKSPFMEISYCSSPSLDNIEVKTRNYGDNHASPFSVATAE